MSIEAMKQALEALEFDGFTPEDLTHRKLTEQAIKSLQKAVRNAALDAMHENEKELGLGFYEQAITTEESSAVQEPVGWLDSNDIHAEFMHKYLRAEHEKRGSYTPNVFDIPVYLHPQPKAEQEPKREPLTDDLPEGFVPLQKENGRLVYAACMNPEMRHYKWLMWKHPDGQWVSKRKLEPWEVMQVEDQRDYGIIQEAAHGIKGEA